MDDLLRDSMQRAVRYLENLNERPVFPPDLAIEKLSELRHPLPDQPTGPAEVLALLDDVGSPATIASAGPRYYGFVTGGALPATLAANWLAGAWDQNAHSMNGSPVGNVVEEVAIEWLLDIFGLPQGTGVGFVTSATLANFSALAAARHALLERAGWDVEAQGLFGAPEIKVVVGDEVHASLLLALSMVGFGRDRVIRVPADDQGRMIAGELPELDDMTLVCIQAGNVNSGAFDPAEPICEAARAAGAWVHVDAAFGMWAAASPELAHLMAGYELADSWATDAHKWLNVPYDSGLVFCREAQHLRAALSGIAAAYLMQSEAREPAHYTPEMSRRARGIEIWAALLSLGRSGLADLIERNCRAARRLAEGFSEAGYTVHNEVVLNQVVVSFGDAETTQRIQAGIQADGTCWCGNTVWQGQTAIRVSVSSWATTDADIERSLEAILRVAAEVKNGDTE